jgi:hypothetical protein
LLFWTDENWKGEAFALNSNSPWAFKPFGYGFRSGNKHFLKNWEIHGYQLNHGDGILLENKETFQISARNMLEKLPNSV